MRTIEINYHKKKIILFFALLSLAFVFYNYATISSGNLRKSTLALAVFLVNDLFLLLLLIYFSRLLLRKGSAFVISNTGIDFNGRKGHSSCLWMHVRSWEIVHTGLFSYALEIETEQRNHKMDLDFLDRKPKEIIELLETYKPRFPG